MADEKPKRSSWWVWCAVGLMLLVGYPLSIGPMYRFGAYLPKKTILIVYRPVVRLAHRAAWSRHMFNDYLGWWRPGDP